MPSVRLKSSPGRLEALDGNGAPGRTIRGIGERQERQRQERQ
jgi:hypothetical protein